MSICPTINQSGVAASATTQFSQLDEFPLTMPLRVRPANLILKLLRQCLSMPTQVLDIPLATEAIHAALRPGTPPGVFTQLVTLGMRLGAPKTVAAVALDRLPSSLSFRDRAELIRQLMLDGMRPHVERILCRAVECVSSGDAPKDTLCVLSALVKTNSERVDDFLHLLIERRVLVEWEVSALCKLIAMSGPRVHTRTIAELLIVAYLDKTAPDAQEEALGRVLRTLAEVKSLGVMSIARVDEVLMKFAMVTSSWSSAREFKTSATELMNLAGAAHAFATLAPSNLLEWRAPQVADVLGEILCSSLAEWPTSRSLAMLLWSISRLAALTAANPMSPRKAEKILSHLVADSSAASGDIVVTVWSLARTVGNFSAFLDELQALLDRVEAADLPKFSWALCVGFGSREALHGEGQPIVQRCVDRYRTRRQGTPDSGVELGDDLALDAPLADPDLSDAVMLWDSASLAGISEPCMPHEPIITELIANLDTHYPKVKEPTLTVGHVGPITTGMLLESLGIHHAPYVPRYIDRLDRGFRQPIAKFITCEVELSVDNEATRAFVVRGGSQRMYIVDGTSGGVDESAGQLADASTGTCGEPFTGLYVMNDRSSHAEISALNGVANLLSSDSVGSLHLHVSHFPCLSCIYAMQQFRRAFSGIQVSRFTALELPVLFVYYHRYGCLTSGGHRGADQS
ncbi:hypothetical protein FOZ62_021906 [Perkinsus olseni]|uniref:Uncharacterized protein n=1 Tax=Perkinsus olseni TaxID=32597 RepID=A0A7J6U0B5_PEROL|nr:hypothetical protein FOZ62_021906 [Perkinsus olseni]